MPNVLTTDTLFGGRRIEVPTIFIAGASDWGIHQTPFALLRMQEDACADFRGLHLIPGAGHWVQQEQPDAVAKLLIGLTAIAMDV
ncbi:alpha/beta fold hydrolase [Pseudoroseomonas sp. WGS1072]|uniref:alpha/beta fold hydrolase n=1 Tax=Roseomonas sp. WGS1072 TaxID=3366816 RepID=UPI003BF13935